jgi:hypothetical protein
VQRFRVPTALERVGDFSQSTDNLGNIFRTIKNPNSTAACTATNTGGCFADGGVLGRIPANQLYAPGLAVLNIFPTANCPGPQCPGDWTATSAFNLEFTRPKESLTSIQPAIRFDYQPTSSLRGSFRWTGWNQNPKEVILGTIPGWNDSRQVIWLAYQMSASVNYSINSTTFLEASYGRGSDEEAGCALGTSGGAIFCRSGLAVNPVANINSAGLGNLPMLFPDAGVLDKSYYAYRGLTTVNDQMGGQLPIWDATTGKLVVTPSFTWGSRVNSSFSPPNVGFPGFFLDLGIDDYSVSLTKVKSIHTIKGGFYLQKSNKQQQTGAWRPTYNFGNSTTNPLDTGFGFANAAVGSYTQVSQASRYVEGDWLYYQAEGYLQDNWKVNNRLTLDYGVRLVHQQPQYDRHLQSGNFLPGKWSSASAPQLYTATCANGTFPCTGTNRQAFNPVTGKAMGPNTTVLIGTIVQGTGDSLNGIGVPGKDIVATSYKWPMLVAAPRAGAAYDLLGDQSLVLRGGFGLFFDRPSGNTVFGSAANPPSVQNVAISNGRLQDGLSGTGPLATIAAPALTVTDYDGPIQSSVQWNVGMQTLLPMAIALDVSYVGLHNYNVDTNVNINSIDFGTMFLPQNQDPTVTATLLGSNVLPTDNLRAFRGFAAINQHQYNGWSTNHSVQISFNRRFKNGFSFGFNDSIVIANSTSTAPRLQHAADGTASLRADQGDANRLLGRVVTNRQLLKANFVWAIPKLQGGGVMRRSIGAVVNDWQLSGIWTGTTGSAYNAGFTYQNGAGNANLTGSPDYGARILVLGDPGRGCSSDPYRQFSTDVFSGPAVGSVGLESSADYLRGCFSSVLDLAIARNIPLGHGRNLQLRVDMFNAPNQAGITGRNTTLVLASPANPTTNQAPVFDPVTGLLNDGQNALSTGARSTDRATPKNAGFGVANGYQAPRNVQFQARFSF